MVRSRGTAEEYDVVEDSEPEREQRRQQRKSNLKNERTAQESPPSHDCHQREIRLHDSLPFVAGSPQPNKEPSLEPDSPASAKNIQQLLHVTNVERVRGHEGVQTCANEPIAEEPEINQITSPNINLTRSTCPSPPPIVTIESFNLTSDSEKEDQLSLMQISRFAYQPSMSKDCSKPAISCQPAKPPRNVGDPGPSRPIDFSKPKKAVHRRVSDDVADSQLTKLLKCIGCGLQWTSRKTAKQKRLHIEQCAKKNFLTKDTVQILIKRETGQGSCSKDDGIPSDSARNDNESATVTLMDSVVPSEPVRKARRQQVVPTVRSLPETREGILDRARDILGPSARIEVNAPQVGAGPPSKNGAEVQSTQPFRRSLLASRNTDPPNLWRSDVVQVGVNQAFGAGALRGREGTAGRMVEGYTEGSPFPQTQQFDASKLAQEFNSRNDEVFLRKRSLSPLQEDSDRVVRPRLI
ncbi:hypothetical protein PAXINDRAFT_96514 [Paxillus involutus ATCC 200175]|nr:hypothetical protein PAXINDRAFT_96514 [Paxillus involutus ATCC 200175]